MFELPKVAIFDLDGTLIDFEHSHFFTHAERILEQLGRAEIHKREIQSRFAQDDLWGWLPVDERASFSDRFWGVYKFTETPPARTLAGALETLAHFHSSGARIAIATARSDTISEVEEELADTGILPYVSVISTRGVDNPSWRDKCDQIRAICRGFGIAERHSIMVGDSPIDISSGKAVGVGNTIGLLSGGIREEVLRRHNPCLVVGHVGEMPGYFPGERK